MSVDSQELYYPIAVLIEELKNEDIQFRLNSIRQLKTIAIALGPEKTRSQLIPFLIETIYDEEEILFALAEQMGNLVPCVGGPEYASSLLAPLENLVAVEEISVREKAIESIRNIAKQLTLVATVTDFYPMVERLSSGDWFTSRTAACALLSVVYPRVSKGHREQLRDILLKLARDETPMVRRTVAGRLGEIALAMVKGLDAEKPPVTAPTKTTEAVNGLTSGTSSGDRPTPIVSNAAMEKTPTETATGATVSQATGASADGVSDSSAVAGDQAKKEETAGARTGPVGAIPASILDEDPEWNDYSFDPVQEKDHVLRLLVPLYRQLIADEQESVRLTALESSVGLLEAIGSTEAEYGLTQLIEQMAGDKSWRVRCTFVDKFIEIFMALEPAKARSRLVRLFIGFLRDVEAEVRAAAAGKIKTFARCLLGLSPIEPTDTTTTNSPVTGTSTGEDNGFDNSTTTVPSSDMDSDCIKPVTQMKPFVDPDVNMEEVWARAAEEEEIVSNLLPAIKALTDDSNTHVRSALAGAVLGLAPLIGNALTVEHLLPVLLGYLQDESPEVRLNLISNLEHVNRVIGLDHLSSSLLPAVIRLAEDPKWRVRLVIIEYMPLLAEQLGIEVFNNQLTDICLGWLIDEVYAIREAAVDNLVRLGQKFGTDWVNQTFVPKVVQLATDRNYLRRMICLQSIISLSEVVGPSVCKQHLLPTTLSMQSDNVPNVRFKVAQALSKLGSQLDRKDLVDEIQTCLRRLSEDSDRDVKFYAHEAMDVLHLSPDDGDVVMTPSQPEATDITPVGASTSPVPLDVANSAASLSSNSDDVPSGIGDPV